MVDIYIGDLKIVVLVHNDGQLDGYMKAIHILDLLI